MEVFRTLTSGWPSLERETPAGGAHSRVSPSPIANGSRLPSVNVVDVHTNVHTNVHIPGKRGLPTPRRELTRAVKVGIAEASDMSGASALESSVTELSGHNGSGRPESAGLDACRSLLRRVRHPKEGPEGRGGVASHRGEASVCIAICDLFWRTPECVERRCRILRRQVRVPHVQPKKGRTKRRVAVQTTSGRSQSLCRHQNPIS